MRDLEKVILAPDELLILRPTRDVSPEAINVLAEYLPEVMRGRVLIVTHDIDVLVVKAL